MSPQPHILMCPPRYYGIEYEINPWMNRRRQVDHDLACRQWADLRDVLRGVGARVSELVGLTLHDVHYDEALVRVVGKGAKERIVPIGRRALGATALYVREVRPRLDRGETADRMFLNARRWMD